MEQVTISKKDRKKQGLKISLLGLLVNLFLFSIKLLVGILSASLGMQADAINNLSDSLSTLVLIVSFHISARPADRDHPFGHARFEYVASSVVAMLITVLSFELFQASLTKILKPEYVTVDRFFYLTVVTSIILKLALYFYYDKQGKKLNSLILKTTAKDSLMDIVATFGLLIASLAGKIFNLALDGYAGLLISLFIFYSGLKSLIDTGNRLLGVKADANLRSEIKHFIRYFPGVLGVHDLIIHDYGANTYFATAHIEVDSSKDIMQSHELIDTIEREIAVRYKINMVIHMDPVKLNDPVSDRLEAEMRGLIRQIDPTLSMHDFRVQTEGKRKKLIFDLKIPDSFTKSNQEIRKLIEDALSQTAPQLDCYVTIDRNYETDTVELPPSGE